MEEAGLARAGRCWWETGARAGGLWTPPKFVLIVLNQNNSSTWKVLQTCFIAGHSEMIKPELLLECPTASFHPDCYLKVTIDHTGLTALAECSFSLTFPTLTRLPTSATYTHHNKHPGSHVLYSYVTDQQITKKCSYVD